MDKPARAASIRVHLRREQGIDDSNNSGFNSENQRSRTHDPEERRQEKTPDLPGPLARAIRARIMDIRAGFVAGALAEVRGVKASRPSPAAA